MKHTPKSPKHFPKNPFNIGKRGDEFMPSDFGEKRATEKSWTDKLQMPKKK